MKKQHLIPCLALLSILLIHSPAHAGIFTAFGPKTFVRGSGKPVMETATFNIKNPNTSYNLHIYNGGINSERSKVSSANITLNGTNVFGTNDFNQQISHLQKNITVSTSNTLQVELRSSTGSGLTIVIEGEDNTPPDVAIASPLNNAYLNTPTINVTGTATDSISWINSVSVNGVPAQLTGETFTASNIQLTEGTNAITAEAVDAAGNKGTSTTSVILDTIPPKITLEPVPSITNKPQLTIAGKVEDASPIAALTIDGSPATLSNNAFTATINLTEGNNNIAIAATDKAGNTASTITQVFLDTIPPTVIVTSPSNNMPLNTSSITVTGTATDTHSGIGAVTVNGVSALISADAYTANIQLTEGANPVTVTATDIAGNKSSTTIIVYIDNAPPVITIASPANGSTVNASTVTVTGTVDDNTATVTVKGNPARIYYDERLHSYLFAVDIDRLTEGINTITATATDPSGNAGSAVIKITYTYIPPDTAAPAIAISSPENGSTTFSDRITVTGTIDDGTAKVTVNGYSVKIDYDRSRGSYSFTATDIKLTGGVNIITVTATNSYGKTSINIVTVFYQQDTTPPIISITSPANGSTVNTNILTVTGTLDDNTATVTVNGIGAAISNNTFTANGIAVKEGANTITATATDTSGNTTTSTVIINYSITLPPDPSSVASTIDMTVATTLANAAKFLYAGDNPIQTGVAEGTIEDRRVAVLRGKALSRDGNHLPAVKVTILGHPEYGSTLTRNDGMFDMAVNGGGWLTVNYEKSGYLPVQRKVDAPWQDYAWLEDVVMIPYDSKVTAIDLNANIPFQVAQGSAITDGDGVRKATLLFPQGAGATMKLPDGTWLSLSNVNVRATEYTVGDNGPKSMPAPLPPTSGYTYAAEFSIDEAVMMRATYVSFSKPVITYIENFLNFPVGGIVPVGWYDREQGTWIPSDNGKIIKILSVSNGIAELDVSGNDTLATSMALAALGITDEERKTLATLYQPGQSLWRVPIAHFTPWDCNWPYGPPLDAVPPRLPEPEIDKPLDDPCTAPGSIIECQNQILGEAINIAGIPFSLNYRSDRVPGRKTAYILKIPISGETVSGSLKRILLEINVAGQRFTQVFSPTPNQTYTFTWDGKDAYGRVLKGMHPINVNIGYVYNLVYHQPADFQRSFAMTSGIPMTASSVNREIILWQEQVSSIGTIGRVGTFDARGIGLGGWTMEVHHAYDLQGHVFLGNGEKYSSHDIGKIITTVAGSGENYFYDTYYTPYLDRPTGISLDDQGNIYVADTDNNRIRKVEKDGIITTPFSFLSIPYGVTVDNQGNVFVADTGNSWILKRNRTGSVERIAGGGICSWVWRTYKYSYECQGYSGDGGPAINAQLYWPKGVAVDNGGNVYVADTSSHRIRKISPDGIITTVAGSGASLKGWDRWTRSSYDYYIGGYSGDGGPATSAQLNSPTALVVDKQGNLYIADSGNCRVRKVGTDGIITTIAGNGVCGFIGDGGLAINASLFGPKGLAVDGSGNLFISDDLRIRKVRQDGIIITVAGNGSYSYNGDNISPLSAAMNPHGIAVDSFGNLYLADTANNRIRKISNSMPNFSGYDFTIPSKDGKELYYFDAYGRHLSTIDTTTNITLYAFTYDTSGYLTSITDRDGNVTTIEHDSSGNPAAIIAPGGQRTELTVNSNGYLESVINPAGETHQMTYPSDGLLLSFTKPKGTTSTFAYDSLGRLIKDEDPAGGVKALVRTKESNGHTVTITTAENLTTIYKTEQFTAGASRRTNTDPNGLTTITNTGTDGTRTTTAPDGTVTTTTEGADPRFGMQAPLTSSMTITTPGGLTYSYGEARSVTLSDENNPLSIVIMTDTKTINGKTFTSFYDASLRKTNTTTPVGRQRFTLLDAKGRVYQEQFAGLNAVTYGYDDKGRLISITEGGRTTTINYDSLNQISSITDAAGRTVGFAYDLAGRVTQQTLPDGRIIAYTYDANGNVTSITPPGRPSHNFTFDPRDLETYYNPPDIGIGTVSTQYAYNLDKQLTQITRPDGQAISLNYDSGGRLSTMTMPSGQLTYSYNATTGNLSSVAAPGETLSYSYDGSLLTGQAWSGAVTGSVGFGYNNDFRITSESVNGANSVSYSYDNDGLLTQTGSLSISRDTQNGLITGSTLGSVTDSFAYSTFGEPSRYTASVSGSTLLDVQYTRDSLGRITSKTETVSGTTSTYAYTYDQAGRLTDVSTNGVNTGHYDYDTNGNRVGWAVPTGSGTATYDNQDRLVSYGSTTYSYTANGELLSKSTSGQTMTYNYDVLGNLKSATLADGTAIEYIVDGQNRKIGKKVNGALVQGFLYKDQLKPVAELDGAGNVVSRFVYGNRPNIPDYMIKGGITYRIITDHLGSPRLVVNSSTGAIAQQMDYNEFGEVINDTNPGFTPFGFAGGLYDRDTKLTRFGARDYDASVGRWTAKDRIRFAGGTTNLYGYVTNGDPVNYVDPSGLFGWDTIAKQIVKKVITKGLELLGKKVSGEDNTPPTEQQQLERDSDGDGITDYFDPDDDNNGVPDEFDPDASMNNTCPVR